jgi:hypothetical protein
MAALPSTERFILLIERASQILELCRLLGQFLVQFGDALLGRHTREGNSGQQQRQGPS